MAGHTVVLTVEILADLCEGGEFLVASRLPIFPKQHSGLYLDLRPRLGGVEGFHTLHDDQSSQTLQAQEWNQYHGLSRLDVTIENRQTFETLYCLYLRHSL